MLDIPLRPLKDRLINPLTTLIPNAITPTHLTLLALLSGLLSTLAATTSHPTLSLIFWSLNRLLDSLDGAVARARNQASDLGGFIDLLGDFTVYSAIPISCAASTGAKVGEVWHLWGSVAVVEASFHLNNFVLFFGAAVLEKRKAAGVTAGAGADGEGKGRGGERKAVEGKVEELTSVMMRPALIEGFESAMMFTIMLAWPKYTEAMCWSMAALVGVGIVQRVVWLVPVLQ